MISIKTENECNRCNPEMTCEELCSLCMQNMKHEINNWKKIEHFIKDIRGKYGPQLSFDRAKEFHYYAGNLKSTDKDSKSKLVNKYCDSDYDETIANNDKYEKQVFEWNRTNEEVFDIIDEESIISQITNL